MKRLLLPLLAALALPTAVNAEFDPEAHQLCINQKNYIGCMTTNSKSSPSISASKSDYIKNYLLFEYETRTYEENGKHGYRYSFRNTGDKTIQTIYFTVYYLDEDGLAFRETHHREDKSRYGGIKPNYLIRKGWYGIDEAYQDLWSGEIKFQITDIEF